MPICPQQPMFHTPVKQWMSIEGIRTTRRCNTFSYNCIRLWQRVFCLSPDYSYILQFSFKTYQRMSIATDDLLPTVAILNSGFGIKLTSPLNTLLLRTRHMSNVNFSSKCPPLCSIVLRRHGANIWPISAGSHTFCHRFPNLLIITQGLAIFVTF